ncbi:hypothetical protein AMTRI_Chr04g250760 [Amborella trichopoda]
MAAPSLISPLSPCKSRALLHGVSPCKSWARTVAFAFIMSAAVWVVAGRQHKTLIQQQKGGISLEFNLKEKMRRPTRRWWKQSTAQWRQTMGGAPPWGWTSCGREAMQWTLQSQLHSAFASSTPWPSGIGGGGFLVNRSSETGLSQAFDMRETAPAAASQDMYNDNKKVKKDGALTMGVPGELAGLHMAWLQHGRLPWKRLVEPAIRLARDGFLIARYLGSKLRVFQSKIMDDPGLRSSFAPNAELLKTGEICYNNKLGAALQAISDHDPLAFYHGSAGEMLVEDILGMPPSSSGAVGLSLVLNIFASYGNSNAAKGDLGIHRLIEAMKNMLAVRMNLGDPNFVNITSYMLDMLSPEFASKFVREFSITPHFPPTITWTILYCRWSQLRDHVTSRFCIVDANRNAVSMTSTVNYPFGGGMVSQSTGILLNNEMADFSTPTRWPLIVDGQLAGVLGGSNGILTIPAVVQVFLKHFLSIILNLVSPTLAPLKNIRKILRSKTPSRK